MTPVTSALMTLRRGFRRVVTVLKEIASGYMLPAPGC